MKNWGFLTVLEHSRHGLIGGYLVVNTLGRPVEFHCTSPVRTNRAQEILYGTTLDVFLYGEQIAQTLITRAKTKPFAVMTDKSQVLAVQEFVEMPVCFIPNEIRCSEKQLRIIDSEITKYSENNKPSEKIGVMEVITSIPGVSAFRWTEHSVGHYQLAIPELATQPASETIDEVKNASATIDFLEPFERIRLAIEEAQKAA